jgi:hypothetical protein
MTVEELVPDVLWEEIAPLVPAGALRPGKCQTISGSNRSRRVSMSPVANAA